MASDPVSPTPLRPKAIRAANAELVLSHLADGLATTRAELAIETSLTSQALGPILADLVGAGLVIEEPSQRSGPGRPPSAYRLDPQGAISIDLLIRFSDVLISAVDAIGTTFATTRFRHQHGPTPVRLTKRVAGAIEKLLEDAGVSPLARIDLVVSIDGIVDAERQVVLESAAWKATDVDVPELIRTVLPRADAVEVMSHDRRLSVWALAEIDARPTDLVAIVLISNQTHLQLALGGTLVSNRLGSTGSLAHFPIAGNDLACDCGRLGCFGTVSSGSAVVRVYRELTGEDLPAAVDVIDRVTQHDADAIEAVRRSSEWLARGLDALLEVHRPDRLVITGAVGSHQHGGGKQLAEILRAGLHRDRHDLPIDIIKPPSGLGADAPPLTP